MKNRNSTINALLACAVIGWLCASAAFTARAQTAPADSSSLSPELRDVVKLSRQPNMTDDVIVNCIKNSGKTYRLSADDIIYLNSQGVSQGVIITLQTATPANPASSPPDVPLAAPPVVEQPVVPATPTLDYFQAQLAPYGNWVEVPGYGLCWQPAVDPAWRPYYNEGHWEYTDAGWFWQSDYPWGDLAFHYGRWAYTTTGWVWVPGYEYAPAWVVWRHADADGYIGWAALPPGAIFMNGAWEFNHRRVGFDFDFGLGLNFFAFIGYDHFWEHDFRHFIVPRDRLALIYRHSVIENRYHLDHGRFINEGLGRDRMAALTHRDVKVETVRDLRDREERHNALARRDDVHNFRAGSKPDGRKTVEPRTGEGSRVAQNRPDSPDNNHTERGGQPGKFQPGRPDDKNTPKIGLGKTQETPKGQSSSKGNSQGSGKGETPEPK